MKPYINALLTRLGTVSALKTIDTNWGQLAYEQPPVQFPCALVDIQSTSVQSTRPTANARYFMYAT